MTDRYVGLDKNCSLKCLKSMLHWMIGNYSLIAMSALLLHFKQQQKPQQKSQQKQQQQKQQQHSWRRWIFPTFLFDIKYEWTTINGSHKLDRFHNDNDWSNKMERFQGHWSKIYRNISFLLIKWFRKKN